MIEQHIAERLQIENAELRNQIQNAIEALRAAEMDRDTLMHAFARTEREVGRAQGLLVRYGTHSVGCGGYGRIAPNNPTECTCGLRDELKRIEKEDE